MKYWIYVHHFAGDGSLAASGAKIRAYGVPGILDFAEIAIPSVIAAQGAKYWHVLAIGWRHYSRVVNKLKSWQAVQTARKA
jgi:hypothetical protein